MVYPNIHNRTFLGCMVRGRWCTRHIMRHMRKHKHKYIAGGMAWAAFFMLAGDLVAALNLLLPTFMVEWIETHRWIGLAGAFISHTSAMLERR